MILKPKFSIGESIRRTDSDHLFYNLFITLLRLWRATDNEPLRRTIRYSTSRYPDIEVAIVPGRSHLMADPLIPGLAGALVWHVLERCVSRDFEPTYWDAQLESRDRLPDTIGIVRTHSTPRRSAALVSASSSIAPSANASLSSVFTPLGQNSSITLKSDRITTQIDFKGAMPGADPQITWLNGFLAWSTSMLSAKDPSAAVSSGVIHETTYVSFDGIRISFRAAAEYRRTSLSPLTYSEFFIGIQDILEVVAITSQFEPLVSTIKKDGVAAAAFEVHVSQSSITVA